MHHYKLFIFYIIIIIYCKFKIIQSFYFILFNITYI